MPRRRPVECRVLRAAPVSGRAPPAPTQASTVTLHITEFEGGHALSEFRVQQLLPRLQAVASTRSAAWRPATCTWSPPTTRPAAAERERLAALLTYGEPFDGAAAGRAARRHAAPGHGVALGLQGHRHRPQLRPRGAAHRARHRYRAAAARPAAGRQGRRSTPAQLRGRRRAAARPHDRERAGRPRRRRSACSPSCRPQPMEHVDVLGGGRAALEQANTQLRPGAGRRRDRLPGRRLHAAWAATRPTSS